MGGRSVAQAVGWRAQAHVLAVVCAPVQVFKELKLGDRLVHPVWGPGAVAAISVDDERGKPFKVQFDSGEVHHYSAHSALKLLSQRVEYTGNGSLATCLSSSLSQARAALLAGDAQKGKSAAGGLLRGLSRHRLETYANYALT